MFFWVWAHKDLTSTENAFLKQASNNAKMGHFQCLTVPQWVWAPHFFIHNWSSHMMNIQFSGQSLNKNLLSLSFQRNYLKEHFFKKMGVDSLVPLTHDDPIVLGLFWSVKKRKIRFRVLSNLRIQSWISSERSTSLESAVCSTYCSFTPTGCAKDSVSPSHSS